MESHEGSELQSQLGPGWIPAQTPVYIRLCTTTALSFSFPICEMDMLILHWVLVRVEWMDWHVYHVTPIRLMHVVLKWWQTLLLFLLLLRFFLLLYFSRPLCCQNFISLYFCITAKILRPFSALRCYLLVPFNSFLFTVWAVRSSSPGTACGVYILSTELWGRLLSTKAQNLVQCILGSWK